LNDHIMVGFKNDKATGRAKIISESEFPVTNIFYDKTHIYTVVDLSDNDVFFRYIAALSDFIIEKYEKKILKRIININHPEIPNINVSEIIKLKNDDGICERKRVVQDILKAYFLENKSGNIEGIVTFRLDEYKKMLNQLADVLVEEYCLNKEYDDFIDLLRYFINVQSSRAEIVYIVVNDEDMYTVLDEKKHDITGKVISDLVPQNEIKYVTHDDLLISMLISIAPKKIVINNKEKIKNVHLFETVEKVFEKVEYR